MVQLDGFRNNEKKKKLYYMELSDELLNIIWIVSRYLY